jgi:NADH dehydrogenase [ubiquinone] 1 alpha subcomplex assembly factor 7
VDDIPPLEREIRRRIEAAGPMPLAEYMGLCLGDPTHGYYVTRDPLGADGDFITAPEVSQMFGEMIGLWMAATWNKMGAPENVRVVELGPGRGTLMKDALRAMRVMPAFREASVLHLVEISPVLREQQERALADADVPIFWHAEFAEVPKGPAIVVANEYFDALPVNQAVKTYTGWHERCVAIGENGKLVFTLANDSIPHFERLLPPDLRDAPAASVFEWRAELAAMELGRRIAHEGGGALVIDYGHTESAFGDTLQAVGRHAYADVLSAPGTIDLTAHVDFAALIRAVETMGARGYGPIDQSQLLRRLGIETRAANLKAQRPDKATEIDVAMARLIGYGRSDMGGLFKAAAFAHPSLGPPPAFEP